VETIMAFLVPLALLAGTAAAGDVTQYGQDGMTFGTVGRGGNITTYGEKGMEFGQVDRGGNITMYGNDGVTFGQVDRNGDEWHSLTL
jgi:hypothetical protein